MTVRQLYYLLLMGGVVKKNIFFIFLPIFSFDEDSWMKNDNVKICQFPLAGLTRNFNSVIFVWISINGEGGQKMTKKIIFFSVDGSFLCFTGRPMCFSIFSPMNDTNLWPKPFVIRGMTTVYRTWDLVLYLWRSQVSANNLVKHSKNLQILPLT